MKLILDNPIFTRKIKCKFDNSSNYCHIYIECISLSTFQLIRNENILYGFWDHVSCTHRFHKYQDVFKPRVLPCIFLDFCFTWSCKHCYSICFGMRIKIFLHYGKENPQMHYTKYSVMSVCSRWLYPAKSNNIFKVLLTRKSDACLH